LSDEVTTCASGSASNNVRCLFYPWDRNDPLGAVRFCSACRSVRYARPRLRHFASAFSGGLVYLGSLNVSQDDHRPSRRYCAIHVRHRTHCRPSGHCFLCYAFGDDPPLSVNLRGFTTINHWQTSVANSTVTVSATFKICRRWLATCLICILSSSAHADWLFIKSSAMNQVVRSLKSDHQLDVSKLKVCNKEQLESRAAQGKMERYRFDKWSVIYLDRTHQEYWVVIFDDYSPKQSFYGPGRLPNSL